jgi:uncharacterized protein (TIGR02996 family)
LNRRLAELYAAVYAAPADDAPRSVLADALQEAGDPRGEFIALQLAGQGTPREAALLRKHRKVWLGALAPAIRREGMRDGAGKPVFRRGFLAAATVDDDGRGWAGRSPEWATVEELWFWGSSKLVPAMAAARVLHRPRVADLVEEGVALGVCDLDVRIDKLEDGEELARCDRLGAVTTLRLEGLGDWLPSARFAAQLRVLEWRWPKLLREVIAKLPRALEVVLPLEAGSTYGSTWLADARLVVQSGVGRLEHGSAARDPWLGAALGKLLGELALTELAITSQKPIDERTRADLVEGAAGIAKLTIAGEPVKRAGKPRTPAAAPAVLSDATQIRCTGDTVVVGTRDGVAVLDGELAMREMFRCERPVQALAVSRSYVAAGFGSGLRVFDHRGTAIVVKQSIEPSTIRGLAIAPDESLLVAGCENKAVIVVELPGGKRHPEMKHEYVMGLAISPDGKRVAIAPLDGLVRIVDLAKRRLVQKLAHTRPVTAAVFAGDRVITTSYDGSLRAWRDGKVVASHARRGVRGLAMCDAPAGFVVVWDDGEITLHARDTLAVARRIATNLSLTSIATIGANVVASHANGVVLVDPVTGERRG